MKTETPKFINGCRAYNVHGVLRTNKVTTGLKICAMLSRELRGSHMQKQINMTTPLEPHWFGRPADGIKHCSVDWLSDVKIQI